MNLNKKFNIELAPISNEPMTYSETILYCQFLSHNGYRDWRIPTHEEYWSDDNITGWFDGDVVSFNGVYNKWHIVPVRDI